MKKIEKKLSKNFVLYFRPRSQRMDPGTWVDIVKRFKARFSPIFKICPRFPNYFLIFCHFYQFLFQNSSKMWIFLNSKLNSDYFQRSIEWTQIHLWYRWEVYVTLVCLIFYICRLISENQYFIILGEGRSQVNFAR